MPAVRLAKSLPLAVSELAILVAPLTLPAASLERKAVIFVADTEKRALPSEDSISRLFGLSRAEARLVRKLAEGLRLEEAAEKCGITPSTARTYLKQCFQKTGTDRQAELVRLILTTPELS